MMTTAPVEVGLCFTPCTRLEPGANAKNFCKVSLQSGIDWLHSLLMFEHGTKLVGEDDRKNMNIVIVSL